METVKLVDGRKMPILGLGTWNLTGAEANKSVKEAIKLGYRHFDTAELYGNEKEIGLAIKGVERKNLFIVSKVHPSHLSYKGTTKALEESLERLGTSYLDMYLVHWPSALMDLKGVFQAFKDGQEAGRIRSIGVSNFSTKQLESAIEVAKKIGITISNNQVEFHPGLYQNELLEFCKKNKIAVTAYSPLARGRLTNEKTLIAIGAKHYKSAMQVALRWEIQKGMITIPKATSLEHLQENIDVFDFKLSEQDVTMIDSLG